MGLNAITEFGRQDANVTRVSRDLARVLRPALMHVLTKAKTREKSVQMQVLIAWQTSLGARLLGSGSGPKRARVAAHFEIWQPLRQERTLHRIAEQLPNDWQVGDYRFVRRISADKPEVIVGGPFAWQFCTRRLSAKLHIDAHPNSHF
jgi:hypothetical protein